MFCMELFNFSVQTVNCAPLMVNLFGYLLHHLLQAMHIRGGRFCGFWTLLHTANGLIIELLNDTTTFTLL